jgi:hypothetical protein
LQAQLASEAAGILGEGDSPTVRHRIARHESAPGEPRAGRKRRASARSGGRRVPGRQAPAELIRLAEQIVELLALEGLAIDQR